MVRVADLAVVAADEFDHIGDFRLTSSGCAAAAAETRDGILQRAAGRQFDDRAASWRNPRAARRPVGMIAMHRRPTAAKKARADADGLPAIRDAPAQQPTGSAS